MLFIDLNDNYLFPIFQKAILNLKKNIKIMIKKVLYFHGTLTCDVIIQNEE
jgi:hypothetical protein